MLIGRPTFISVTFRLSLSARFHQDFRRFLTLSWTGIFFCDFVACLHPKHARERLAHGWTDSVIVALLIAIGKSFRLMIDSGTSELQRQIVTICRMHWSVTSFLRIEIGNLRSFVESCMLIMHNQWNEKSSAAWELHVRIGWDWLGLWVISVS